MLALRFNFGRKTGCPDETIFYFYTAIDLKAAMFLLKLGLGSGFIR